MSREGYDRLVRLERLVNSMAASASIVRSYLTQLSDRNEVETTSLSQGNPLDVLRDRSRLVIATWPFSPVIFRDSPVRFGEIQFLSYTECFAAVAWDIHFSIEKWTDFRVVVDKTETIDGAISLTRRVVPVCDDSMLHWTCLKGTLDSYNSFDGIDHMPRARKTEPIELLALAATVEIMGERRRLMDIPYSLIGRYETAEHRRSAVFGPITARQMRYLWKWELAFSEASNQAAQRCGTTSSVAPRPSRPHEQIEILTALTERNGQTLRHLSKSASGLDEPSESFKKHVKELVKLGLVVPGKKGRNSEGCQITESGREVLKMYQRNGAGVDEPI